METNKIRVAILDLYNGEENQGMRCIKDLLNEIDCKIQNFSIHYQVFDSRLKGEIPTLDFDIYISSGGPGSPWDGEGTLWEKDYFFLMDKIWDNNHKQKEKKHIFFICHSFQIMCRYFKIADVIKRKSKSFGIHPVHKTEAGEKDFLFQDLSNPFFIADFREWQAVQPNKKIIDELGAEILCMEKERPHVALERATMAIRISEEIVGTQFHPEADPASMYYHFRKPDRKEFVVNKYGEKRYWEMLEHLQNPKSITLTHNTVIPNFLKNAVKKLRPESIFME